MSAALLALGVIVALVLAALFLHQYGDWKSHHAVVTVSVLLAWHFSLITVLVIPIDVSRTSYLQCVNDQGPEVPSNATMWPPAGGNSTPPLPTSWRDVRDSDNGSVVEQQLYRLANESRRTSSSPAPVSDARTRPCSPPPGSYVSAAVMFDLWRVVYWSSQLLTWLALPLMQSYTQAGDFSVRGKLRAALVDNAVYYGSYLIIAIVLLIYLSFQPDVIFDMAHLKLIVSSASNTWGLLLLVVLLGYSLVQLPRTLWRTGQRGWSLQHAYFRAAKLSAECSEAEELLDELLDSLQLASSVTGRTHPLRPHVDTVLSRVPGQLESRMRRRRPGGADSAPTPTHKSLVLLHRQVIRAVQQHHRTQTLWHALMRQVMELEDVAENQRRRDGFYQPGQPRTPNWIRSVVGPRVEWYWKCLVRGYVLKALALVFGCGSAMVVWSEMTFFNKSPTLSLFAVFINAAKNNHYYTTIEVLSLLAILYLGACTYYAIVNIRVFNFYYLASDHQTDQHSLIFSGMLICRLTPPLCLNFLSMIHMDSHVIKDQIDETAYTQVMGHMDVLSILSEGFNLYWPMCMLAFCLATWFSVGARLLSCLGFQQFADREDEMTVDLVDEGRQLAARERRRMQRREVASTGAARPSAATRKQQSGSRLNRSASTDSTRPIMLDTQYAADFTAPDHRADVTDGDRGEPPSSWDWRRRWEAYSSAPQSARAQSSRQRVDDLEDEDVLYSSSRPPPSRGFFDDV